MIKVKDIAFVRFSTPDLEQMERFLSDFGLMVTKRENDVIYAPHRPLAVSTRHRARRARVPGRRVRFTDPDGYAVEVAHPVMPARTGQKTHLRS